MIFLNESYHKLYFQSNTKMNQYHPKKNYVKKSLELNIKTIESTELNVLSDKAHKS